MIIADDSAFISRFRRGDVVRVRTNRLPPIEAEVLGIWRVLGSGNIYTLHVPGEPWTIQATASALTLVRRRDPSCRLRPIRRLTKEEVR
jgi:hypothetical protein